MKSAKRKREKIVDINDLVLYITARGTKPLLFDEVWKCYGYKKRPSHKNLATRVFRKRSYLEKYIIKEILTMGLVDVVSGIKKSKDSSVTKLLISIGVIDQVVAMTKHIFLPEELIESFLSTYESYLGMEKTELHAPIVFKAKEKLNKKDFARFTQGTVKLLKLKANGDFLVKSDRIREVIEKSYKEKKLNISMSDAEYEKYSSLLREKILQV